MSFSFILEKIKEYDSIVVFRHIHPDCDACGSQFALKTWIQHNYPEKKVYAAGYEINDQGQFPAIDQVSDEIIQNSLAIICDTSGPRRVDDDRYAQAQYVIKIDHHPDVEPFGDFRFIDTKAAASCEILTMGFYEYNPDSITKEVAFYLYQGLLTDSLCFRTSNTTSNTLKAASILTSYGLDIPAINRLLFDKSLERFKIANYIRNHVEIDGQFARVILSQDELQSMHLTPHNARTFIDEIGQIRELQIWTIFTELDDGSHNYDGSLRSKTIRINDLAGKYHGGGHANASGVNHLTPEEVESLCKELKALLVEEPKTC